MTFVCKQELNLNSRTQNISNFSLSGMESDENCCRICRQESGHLESLQSYREGLPISVIIMIICPIKIERAEPATMPKFVCAECLDIVLSSYRLRDESLQSDRYFRDGAKSALSFDEVEEFINIKQEESLSFADPLPSTSAKQKKKIETRIPRPQGLEKFQRTCEKDFPYRVECHKINKKSPAWEYFGRLVHLNGDIVRHDSNYNYCKLCVDEHRPMKTKYKDTLSTSKLLKHIGKVHGIERDEDCDAQSTENSVHELPYPCTKDGCEQIFKSKTALDIHTGIEHTGLAPAEPSNTEHRVDVSQKGARQSIAWSYFGPLLNSNSEVIDDDHNYCRLCVNEGIIKKYKKPDSSCSGGGSTNALLNHLQKVHLKLKPKPKGRKRPRVDSATTSCSSVEGDEDD